MQIGISVKNLYQMTNSVDPDETAHYEPSHQDLQCLRKYLIWSIKLNNPVSTGLIIILIDLLLLLS